MTRWETVAPYLREHRYMLVPEIVVLQAFEMVGGVQPPAYWAGAYAGSQMLARWLLDRPEICAGKRVVEIGAGAGLPALAAAKAGAAEVFVCDTDGDALKIAKQNAGLNRVTLQIAHAVRMETFDVVIAACLFDDVPEFALQMVESGKRCLYGAQANLMLPGEPFVEKHRQPFSTLTGRTIEVMVYEVTR